jgi:hypothetical protein
MAMDRPLCRRERRVRFELLVAPSVLSGPALPISAVQHYIVA